MGNCELHFRLGTPVIISREELGKEFAKDKIRDFYEKGICIFSARIAAGKLSCRHNLDGFEGTSREKEMTTSKDITHSCPVAVKAAGLPPMKS